MSTEITDTTADCQSETLSEVTDRFLIRSGIDKKKNFARYLILAEEVWEEIFQNTLWVIKSVWQPIIAGTPYNFVNIPKDCQRLLSVGIDDKCRLIQPLFYNNQLNVIAKPTTKKCGCSCPDCGGLCEAVNSMTVTTKLMFTILGVNYYQTCWTKYCPNGDIIEFCKTPAKKFNNLIGDGGDFNDDYNRDYDRADPPFSDYTIEYITTQNKICKLEIAPCGCPVNTTENEKLFIDSCGCYTNWNCGIKKRCCNQFSPNINNNHKGEVKISECGTKVYYNPSPTWNRCLSKEVPDYLLVNYQTTGVSCGAETLVPKYARNLLYACLDNGRKEYNSSYSLAEKSEANYKKIAEKNNIMAYLSPVSLHELSLVQDESQKW